MAGRQLYSLGYSRERLSNLSRSGWLLRIHQGVYAVGYLPITQRGRWMAAVLALGPGAVLSHRSAAALWKIWGELRGARPHVMVRNRTTRGHPRIQVHRPRIVPAHEFTSHAGIPVTTPLRTLRDLRRSLSRRNFERAIDEAERLDLADAEELAALLPSHAPGSTLTRSELEELFLSLIREKGLPTPLVNQPLLDAVPDFLWPAEKLIAELDGRASHGTRAAFQKDRDRDTRLSAHGYLTLRFTHPDVTRRPAVVADRVRRALRRRRPAGSRPPPPGTPRW